VIEEKKTSDDKRKGVGKKNEEATSAKTWEGRTIIKMGDADTILHGLSSNEMISYTIAGDSLRIKKSLALDWRQILTKISVGDTTIRDIDYYYPRCRRSLPQLLFHRPAPAIIFT
jgi:hypothetical protein